MTSDESMGWEVFWNAQGMLVLKQNQAGSDLRMQDKEPHLFFEAEELPTLLAELRQAAADGAEMIRSNMMNQNKLIARLETEAAETSTLPVDSKPEKKKGRGAQSIETATP